MDKKIVAVVGMCGSGKSVAVAEFEKQGWHKIYFGGATMLKLKELGEQINPENEKRMREELRRQDGMGAFAKFFLPEIREKHKTENVIIDGLYSWSEYKILKEEFKEKLQILCIATDAWLRRKRLESREVRPLQENESLARDFAEIENLEKGGPIGIADHYILNNGTERDFLKQLRKYIKSLAIDC